VPQTGEGSGEGDRLERIQARSGIGLCCKCQSFVLRRKTACLIYYHAPCPGSERCAQLSLFPLDQLSQVPMSTLVALRLTALLLFSGSALAQIVAPDCLIVPWGWVCLSLPLFPINPFCQVLNWAFLQTFNSLNQNACTVAAYLMSTCNQGCECPSSFATSAV
jgi:hypothetical protein